jgi:HSP20 family protein
MDNQLTHSGPFSLMDRMFSNVIGSHAIDSLFDDSVLAPRGLGNLSMQVNHTETDTHHVYEIDLPGINKNDIKLSYKGKYMTINATRNKIVETRDKEKKSYYKESNYGSLSRTLSLPKNAVPESLLEEKPTFLNGVLTINVKKTDTVNEDGSIQIDL